VAHGDDAVEVDFGGQVLEERVVCGGELAELGEGEGDVYCSDL
jgi:hypothetical protein